MRQPRQYFRPQRAVTPLRAGKAQLPQIRKRGFAFWDWKFRKDRLVQRELQIAALRNVQRCAQQFWMIREEFLHFRRWFEPGLAGGDVRRRDRRQQSARPHRIHRTVM